jgi:hypothetical protein
MFHDWDESDEREHAHLIDEVAQCQMPAHNVASNIGLI